MSKTSELRRQATEAVRSQKWERAVSLYEKLCERDAGNAGFRNELGDIWLKMGRAPEAIECFATAADLYRHVGLTNNAIALHKKILRHDPNRLDSLWQLGEIQLDQGHDIDAVARFLEFLGRVDQVPVAERGAFVQRCTELVELLGEDLQVLTRLEAVFEQLQEDGERARVVLVKARLAHEEGEFDVRDRYLQHAREIFDGAEGLPEYGQLRALIDGPPEDESDVPEEGTSSASAEATDRIELDEAGLDLGFDFDEKELSGVVEAVSGEVAPLLEEGRIASGTHAPIGATGEDEDGVHDANEPVEDAPEDARENPAEENSADSAVEVSGSLSADAAPESGGSIDLLEEILSDGNFDVRADEERQVDTIAREMQGQIAGQVDPEDHAGQYDLGIVYLDMGLHEQAIDAFERAAGGVEQELKALEMKGTCLLRLERIDEAAETFETGLAIGGHPERAYLGLRYGIGACHEARGEFDRAREAFEAVCAIDESFLDARERLERVSAAASS